MRTKFLVEEDFVNYKVPAMFVGLGISCSFKCEKECGEAICHNSPLAHEPTITIEDCQVMKRYMSNPISQAIIIGGLEPFDNFEELTHFINEARKYTFDDIVIYTGYNEDEIRSYISMLSLYPNIIVKFGRFRPNETKHKDPILGIELASSNQYAKCISAK